MTGTGRDRRGGYKRRPAEDSYLSRVCKAGSADGSNHGGRFEGVGTVLIGSGIAGDHAMWSSGGCGCENTREMLPPLRDFPSSPTQWFWS